jgi:hypothetical protein
MQVRHLHVLFSTLFDAARLVSVDGMHKPILGVIADMPAGDLRTIRLTRGVATLSDPVGSGGCVASIVSSAVRK